MAKFEKRLQAQKLRREKGLSIKKIASILEVSKSTVSKWCLDIELTTQQKAQLLENNKRGGLLGALANRRKKEARITYHDTLGKRHIKKLSKRDFLIAGVALYWAEGSKADRTKLSFINSDPGMIQFMYQWFQEVIGVQKIDFMPRISINEMHRPRIKKVIKYWSKLLALPRSQFGNPVFIKTKQKKVYENYDLYYGLLSLKMRRSTEIKYRILGLIKGLASASR